MKVGLPHRRPITDLVEGNNQWLIKRPLTITFNGEIWHSHLFKNELKEKGHIFLTNSDTEVILKAYMQWGDCF